MTDGSRSMHLVVDEPMTIHLVPSKNKDCDNDRVLKGFRLARAVLFSVQDKRALYDELEIVGGKLEKGELDYVDETIEVYESWGMKLYRFGSNGVEGW